jgi:hypothetical protein
MGGPRVTDMHSNSVDVNANTDWYMVVLAVIAIESAIF